MMGGLLAARSAEQTTEKIQKVVGQRPTGAPEDQEGREGGEAAPSSQGFKLERARGKNKHDGKEKRKKWREAFCEMTTRQRIHP